MAENNLQQDILQNAISSLKEGLSKYTMAIDLDDDQQDQYKFAILHFTHFIELSLKNYINSMHPLLIYSKPYDKNLSKSNKYHARTISIEEALQLIINSGVIITSEFYNDLIFVKTIRNQIMHSKFSFGIDEIDEKLGRLAKAFNELNRTIFKIGLESLLNKEEYEVFDKLYKNYFKRLKDAKNIVMASEEIAYAGYRLKEYDQVYWHCYLCPNCEEATLIPNADSKTGDRCAFCNNEESDEIENRCCMCEEHTEIMENGKYYCGYHYKMVFTD